MKKITIEKLQNLDARCVGIKATKVRQQNYITLDEVALEAARQLFRSVPFTIEEQVPEFTAWAGNFGKNTTKSRRNNYSKRHWG
jgi:hypothetical protein